MQEISTQSKALFCYQCSKTDNLLEYDEESCICKICYAQQLEVAEYYKSKRTNFFPEIDQINEGIYLGNEDAAIDISILQKFNITAICTCGSHLLTPFINNQKYIYKVYEIADFPKQKIKHLFEDHYEWMTKMKNQKRNILMHCAAGVSRSASFTIAYFMREKKIAFINSFDFVKSKRKWINPNSGFRQELTLYENQLLQKQII